MFGIFFTCSCFFELFVLRLYLFCLILDVGLVEWLLSWMVNSVVVTVYFVFAVCLVLVAWFVLFGFERVFGFYFTVTCLGVCFVLIVYLMVGAVFGALCLIVWLTMCRFGSLDCFICFDVSVLFVTFAIGLVCILWCFACSFDFVCCLWVVVLLYICVI